MNTRRERSRLSSDSSSFSCSPPPPPTAEAREAAGRKCDRRKVRWARMTSREGFADALWRAFFSASRYAEPAAPGEEARRAVAVASGEVV